MTDTTASPGGIADLEPLARAREQRAWNWYDWANSAYYTTVLSVMFAPYMITVAGRAAGCPDSHETCERTVSLLGLPLAAGSLPFYLTSFATIASAFVLPVLGALVDRSGRKKWQMAGFAWAGALCAALLYFLKGDNWQLGAVAIVLSSVLGGCSLVSYYAILVDISTEQERDRASARGWAWGYLGGGLLLAVNLGMFLGHDALGLSSDLAVRLSMLSAALWWAGFTLIPVTRLRNHPPRHVVTETGAILQRSFGQLWTTLKEMRGFPSTLTFLVAFLFFNDGIQTVIAVASTYGSKQLGIGQSVLIATILLIQFVAFAGARLFGRLAQSIGSYRSILWGIYGWMVIVVLAMLLPAHNTVLFLALGIAIAVVLGGTQALSRSFFSLLIPRGREGEYFALYNACERGTSWFGTFLFGVVFQLSGSYRPAIVALVVFFVLGAFFMLRLDPRRGILEAGNRTPSTF
jgi:UMF1 family MFS transporter